MAKRGKRAKRMSIDTNIVSVQCLKDILKALEAERMMNTNRSAAVSISLLLETTWLKSVIELRGG